MGRTLDREELPTLDKFLTVLDGSYTPQTLSGADVNCDFCESPIEPGVAMTNYVSNKLINEEFAGRDDDAPFYFLRAYCNDCHRRELLDPCRSYLELLLEAELDPDRRLRNFEVIDYSTPEEGIPYDPIELWEVTHPGTSWEEFNETAAQIRGHPVRMGPADIADDLRYHGIDAREVYGKEGVIDLSEDELQSIRDRIASNDDT